MVTVKFFTLLRLLVKKPSLEVQWEKGDTIGSLLAKTREKAGIDFLHKLVDDTGELKTGTMILLNGKNIFHLNKMNTPIEDGDTVDLFPPGGGG